jgi:hypothetical protein
MYARSVNSSNLADDELSHNTDSLAAMALRHNLRCDDTPQQREKKIKSSDFGSLLFRVKYADDKKSKQALFLAWEIKITKRAEKKGWQKDAKTVADYTLYYFLHDTCTTCHGRAAPKIENTPILADIICPSCSGSGKKPLGFEGKIREYILDAVKQLNSLEYTAGSLAIKKLSDEVRGL